MTRNASRRRFFFFFTWAALLSGVLILMGAFAAKRHLQIEEWTSILREPERRALTEAVMDREIDFEEDARLELPGMHSIEKREFAHQDKQLVEVISVANTESIAVAEESIKQYWKAQGLQCQSAGDFLTAFDKKTDTFYSAHLTPHPDQAGAILINVWKVTHRQAGKTANSPRADLLPALPDGSGNLEMGRPGKPGYAMMFHFYAQPGRAYDVVFSELEKRGWEPFESASRFAEEEGTNLKGALVCVLRHETEPLGCQLMVGKAQDSSKTSQVFISLF